MSHEKTQIWMQLSEQWRDIMIAVCLSCLSGLSSYLHKMTYRRPVLFSLIELVADMLSAGLAGFITLMVCLHLTNNEMANLSPWAIGALVTVAGHAAPKLLNKLDTWLVRKLRLGKSEVYDDDNNSNV